MRNEHHQIPGQGYVSRADHRTALLECLDDTFRRRRTAGDLQSIRIRLKHLAAGIHNGDGIEVSVLRLQAKRLLVQLRRIVPVLGERFGAVVQAAVRRPEELTDTGGHFRRVGPVGLQRRIDQGLALHPIRDKEAVTQRRQYRHQYE
ncbi:hypothetical protein D3C72_1832460 [compost metagenome]